MAIYRVAVGMPQSSTLARDWIYNNLHFEHVGAPVTTVDWNTFLDSVIDVYQANYGSTAGHVKATAYDVGPIPNPPLATRTKGLPTTTWSDDCPREVALCLSFASDRSSRNQRGRIYLSPGAKVGVPSLTPVGVRPSQAALDWALDFFRRSNNSFPDVGGVDWKFGIYSPTKATFYQAHEAWVDDEWDTQRRRGLKATKRITSTREG